MLYNLPSTLKILNLSGIVNMNDELLDIVTSHTPILLKLDISKANISNKGLFYLHRLKNLNTCNLSFTKIKDESFEIIGKLPNLQKLNISMCNLITNNGIEILVKLNPNLTHLSMEYTNVGQLAVNYMTDYMKHPIYINMNYTHYSSFINVSFLKKKCKILTYKSI
jgi:Leucine-rich repeat (LRR) protein